MVVVGLLGVERHEEVEVVAPVDVHVLRDRAEPMRGIPVSRMLRVEVERPSGAPCDRCVGMAVHGMVAAVVLEAALVVDVAGFAMDNLSEHPLSDHVEHRHLVLAIAAVLKHHAGHLRALARLHHLPAAVQRKRPRDLDKRDLAMFHRAHRARHVQMPWRHAVHDVHLVHLADAPVAVRPGERLERRRLAVVREPLDLPVDPVLEKVRQGHDLRAGNHRDAVHGGRASRPHANNGDAHLLHRLEREALHRRAARTEELQRAARTACRHRDGAHPRRSSEEVPAIYFHSHSSCLLVSVNFFA